MSTQDILNLVTHGPRPVVSFPASQSLQASTAVKVDGISTGLSPLDDAICPPPVENGSGPGSDPESQGILQGHVTEVFGPPGVGKTSLALNIASQSLKGGSKVIWIDTGSPLPQPRVRSILLKSTQASEPPQTPDDLAESLIYFRARSLPHLLALLLHPPAGFPPEEANLLVIDSVSGLFPSYFPNPTELKSRLAQSKTTDKFQVQWLMNRNWNVTSDLANQLMKLATTYQLAVLVINQTRTRIRGQPRATLCPVLSGGSWESSIHTRIVLYRDFPASDEENVSNIRFAEVMKRSGKTLTLRLEENVVPFVIEEDGLRGIDRPQSPQVDTAELGDGTYSASQRKRKADEIADSQDEDSDGEFGWIEGDDAELLEEN